jgi:anti-sigma28 factor (negative regulator of flagellin synthesis)
MEIGEKARIKYYAAGEMARPGKHAQPRSKSADRKDLLMLSANIKTKLPAESEIRAERVAEARRKIVSGEYENPAIIEEIVKRLMEQFGL